MANVYGEWRFPMTVVGNIVMKTAVMKSGACVRCHVWCGSSILYGRSFFVGNRRIYAVCALRTLLETDATAASRNARCACVPLCVQMCCGACWCVFVFVRLFV